MIIDYTNYAWENIKHRKLRSWLTLIGIIIGVAAVVSLVSLGQGLQSAVSEQFNQMGTDKIMVSPGASIFGGMGLEGIEITDKDISVIEKVNGVKLVGGFVSKVAEVKFKDEIKYTWVTGLSQDETKEIIESIQSFNIDKGRNLKEGDNYKTVIGIMLTQGDVFEKEVKVRDTLIIEGQDFRVVGALETIGNPQDDSQLIIPLDVARDLFNEPDSYSVIIVQVKENADVGKVAEKIEEELRDSRDVDEGDEDFSIQTSEQLMESFGDIFMIVTAVLIGIATISLLVGGIGIMNTMYTAVLQRTSEIGVMKAIGAKNSDILKLFLIESGFYGLIGGLVGIVIGIVIAKVVVLIASQYVGEALLKADFSPLLIIGSLAFSFLVGALSGVLPAVQASKLKPVEALRYE